MPLDGMKLEELWLWLLKDPKTLSDDQIARLLLEAEEVEDFIRQVLQRFPFYYKQVQQYRKRKAELLLLPTEELESMRRRFMEARAVVLQREDADDLPDECFEAPHISDDEYIVNEILKERNPHRSCR
jgi:hypothetical protein